jgi:hypothetical protein
VAAALEGFAGLGAADYRDSGAAGAALCRFRDELQREGNNSAIYVRTLAEALRSVGKHADARIILLAHDPEYRFLDDSEFGVFPENRGALIGTLFDLIGNGVEWLEFLWGLA